MATATSDASGHIADRAVPLLKLTLRMRGLQLKIPATTRRRVLVLGLLAGVGLVPAPAWCASGSADPRALGVEEARLSYCAKSDPKDAVKVQDHIRRLTMGEASEALEVARKSPEYKKGYDTEIRFIGLIDERNAARICSAQTKDKK